MILCYTNVGAQMPHKFYLDSLNKALAENPKEDKKRVDILNRLSWNYRNVKPNLGIEYGKKASDLALKLDYISGYHKGLSYVGINYKNQGNFIKALEYFIRVSESSVAEKDEENEAYSYVNMGMIYHLERNFSRAENSFKQAETIGLKIKNDVLLAYVYLNLGRMHKDKANFSVAIDYLLKSILIRQKLKDELGIGAVYQNMAEIYTEQGEYDQANEFFSKSIAIGKKFEDMRSVASNNAGLANLYVKQKKYDQAKASAQKSIEYLKSVGDQMYLKEAYFALYKVYDELGDYKTALEYQTKYITSKDSLFSEEASQKIQNLETVTLLEQNRKMQEDKGKISLIIFIVSILCWVFLIGMVSIFYIKNRQIKKINDELAVKNDQIRSKSTELQNAFNEIEYKNSNITQSMQYAHRIQQAILPSLLEFNAFFPNNFILNKPRDIVGGDFYWLAKDENVVYLACADCTGHGVSGALLASISNMILNKVFHEKKVRDVGLILSETHVEIVKTLNQEYTGGREGLDILLCAFDFTNKTVDFAGANHYIYYCQNETISVIRGNKYGIGGLVEIFGAKRKYDKTIIDISVPTTFYLSTDGYQDQFGGLTDQKYMRKQLTMLLETIHNDNMSDQKELLKEIFDAWKQDREQTDDVLVIGIKV